MEIQIFRTKSQTRARTFLQISDRPHKSCTSLCAVWGPGPLKRSSRKHGIQLLPSDGTYKSRNDRMSDCCGHILALNIKYYGF